MAARCGGPVAPLQNIANLFIQPRRRARTAWTETLRNPHHAPVRVLTHIKKLDDCFGQFLVRASCACGACREIEPEALVCLVGWSMTLEALAPRLRYSHCGCTGRARLLAGRPLAHGDGTSRAVTFLDEPGPQVQQLRLHLQRLAFPVLQSLRRSRTYRNRPRRRAC